RVKHRPRVGAVLPLPSGERVGVRGSRRDRWLDQPFAAANGPPLPLRGRGTSVTAVGRQLSFGEMHDVGAGAWEGGTRRDWRNRATHTGADAREVRNADPLVQDRWGIPVRCSATIVVIPRRPRA